MKTYADLMVDKDKVLEAYLKQQKAFSRDEVWSLLRLIESIESRVGYLEDVIKGFESAQEHTLAGALRKLRR